MSTKTVTHQQLVDLVMKLPEEHLISVYDFARFVESHPIKPNRLQEDLFGETEDEIHADEKEWQQQFAASRESLRAIAREAAEKYHAGETKPMQFTPDGRLAR